MLNANDFFRICGQDTEVYLVFSKLYDKINRLSTKSMSMVSENLFLTLYTGLNMMFTTRLLA